MQKQISFKTNTAFLLNTFCQEGLENTVFGQKKIKDWLNDRHEDHWKGRCDSTIIVTYKIKKVNENDRRNK